MKLLIATLLTTLSVGLIGCDAPQPIDDAGITTKIKSKMVADSRTSALKVGVDTVGGVVTLTGSVPAETEKKAAAEIALATDGVKNVVNSITINPATTSVSNIGEKTEAAAKEAVEDMSDAGVLAKIKTKFLAESIVGTNVDVVNGVATLNGTVEDASEKTRAEQIAKATSGVKGVKNMLKVEKKK